MKKICIVLLIMLVTGCQDNKIIEPSNKINTNEEKYVDILELSKDYNIDNAIKDGYVIRLERTNYNIENLNKFYENVDKGISDEIRIATTTIEGDIIIYNLHYYKSEYSSTGNFFNLTVDDTRDKYASNDMYDVYIFEEMDRTDGLVLKKCNHSLIIDFTEQFYHNTDLEEYKLF